MEANGKPLLRVEEGCYCWAGPELAQQLARSWSLEEGGQWWVGSGTVTHNRGGRCVYYVHAGRLSAILEARRAASELAGEARSYTVGGIARGLLKWLGAPQRHWSCTEEALSGLAYGYLHCQPGSYPGMILCDLKAAFWEALCRLPSIRVTWLNGQPLWGSMIAEERSRWEAIKERCRTCKPLRNTMIGCMLGSNQPAVCYCRGERLSMPKRHGPFRGAAMTVVRAVYELTWLQQQQAEAVYANTDNVIVPRGTRLDVWERFGYPYAEQASGNADIIRLGCYQVGDRSTYWYAAGSRLAVPHLLAPIPSKLTLPLWH